MTADILRYMGHKGDVSGQLEQLIFLCREKLSAACTPRHVIMQLSCAVTDNHVMLMDSAGSSSSILDIQSSDLAKRLFNCKQAYIFAATLGAAVDRLITERIKIDSAEGLCLQACAAAQIENNCGRIEQELLQNAVQNGSKLLPRFSPGYGDFLIDYQTDILRILNAHKHAGITETKSHILTPLKSVTAIAGIAA